MRAERNCNEDITVLMISFSADRHIKPSRKRKKNESKEEKQHKVNTDGLPLTIKIVLLKMEEINLSFDAIITLFLFFIKLF